MIADPASLATGLLALTAFVALPCFAAEETGFRRNVGDYSVYLAVMPAEVIKGPLPPEPAGAFPNRSPAARDTHHVMVSIFDSRSGLRISGWRVEARVAALGFSGERRDLEPLSVGGTTVYVSTFPNRVRPDHARLPGAMADAGYAGDVSDPGIHVRPPRQTGGARHADSIRRRVSALHGDGSWIFSKAGVEIRIRTR